MMVSTSASTSALECRITVSRIWRARGVCAWWRCCSKLVHVTEASESLSICVSLPRACDPQFIHLAKENTTRPWAMQGGARGSLEVCRDGYHAIVADGRQFEARRIPVRPPDDGEGEA